MAVVFAFATSASAAEEPGPPVSRTVNVDGLAMHYTTAGQGDPLILLHGYAQTSRMWEHTAIPALSKRFTVIAPDLPGFGDSAIPPDGLDMKTAAERVHALVRTLEPSRKVRIVGHDIGLMVAYAYAAMYPNEVERLVVMDAFLPGIGEWERAYHDPSLWHLTFVGPTPEALVQGRERIYLDHFWNDLAADPKRSVSEADRKAYVASYARPGRIRAGWEYFKNFGKTATDFAELGQKKLEVPVLAITGAKATGDLLAKQMALVATNVQSVVLPDTGHWLIDENPRATMTALAHFL
jgi:pimeloyl-ACP methyl ester carboxylesterase